MSLVKYSFPCHFNIFLRVKASYDVVSFSLYIYALMVNIIFIFPYICDLVNNLINVEIFRDGIIIHYNIIISVLQGGI